MNSSIIVVIYILSLTCLTLFSFYGAFLSYLRLKNKKEKKHEFSNKFYPLVTVQLPVYNEKYVIKRLLKAVSELDYPKDKFEIQILDDSTDETSEIIKNELPFLERNNIDVTYIKRNNRNGFKAGALREGLKFAKGDFIAIFDADFLPQSDFLKKTLGYFVNEKIALVQARWGFLNESESLLTKLQALNLNMHFFIEQTHKYLNNYFITFNGTCGIWRKKAIVDGGNWETDTLTEDLDLSIRVQKKGWQFIFLRDYEVKGELPGNIIAYKNQQNRWMKGIFQNAIKNIPAIINSKIKLKIKLQLIFQLLLPLSFVVVLSTILLSLPFIFSPKNGETIWLLSIMPFFFLGFVSNLTHYILAQKDAGLKIISSLLYFPLLMSLNIGMAIKNSFGIFEVIVNKNNVFIRTPKNIKHDKDKNYLRELNIGKEILLEFFFFLYSLLCVAYSIYFNEILSTPFFLLFLCGFGMVLLYSYRDILLRKNE